jgi:hypothetical protein
MGEDSPQKRKRTAEDGGEREQKKAHLEDRRLGIENLHMDVGEKYLLCRTRKALPPPQAHIQDCFGLSGTVPPVSLVALP